MKLTFLFLFFSICSFAQTGLKQTSSVTGVKTDSVTVVFPESVQKDLQEIEKSIIELKQEVEKLEATRMKIINALYGGQGIDPAILDGQPKYTPGKLKFKKR